MNRQVVWTICLGIFVLTGMVLAEATPTLELSNDFIKITVTQTEQEMGRFAVDTTNGDPSRPDDNNKPLIYGHPTPWTSYTTVRLDDQDFVFGGPTTRRSGAEAAYGRIVSPPHRDGSELVTIVEMGGVQVEERLALTTNPYSGYEDTARIRYRLTNQSSTTHSVGLRAVLDTMLGSNDGAPFRIGGLNINTQAALAKKDMPDIWQAFDSLSSPTVIAQGLLQGYGATTPDWIFFTDWGTAADHLWQLPLAAGQDFIRAGEEEPDSAIALFWTEQPLAPQAVREITILYGLGGVTMAPGASFLGIAAPAEIVYDPKRSPSYQVLTYVENHTSRIARDVEVRLNLPAGIILAGGPSSVKIEQMEPNEIRQLLWTIKADGNAYGASEIELSVTGKDLTANSLKRSVRILGPPILQAAFLPPDLTHWQGGPFKLYARISNTGGSTARDLWVTMNLSGIRLAEGETSGKYLVDIAPGESAQFYWWVTPENAGTVSAVLNGSHQGGNGEIARTAINVPNLPGTVYLSASQEVSIGEAFCVEVVGEKLGSATGFSFDFCFDPHYFKILRVAKGRFVSDGASQWQAGNIDSVNGTVRGISCQRQAPLNEAKTSVVRFFLVPVRAGETLFNLENLKFRAGDREISVNSSKFAIKIKEAKL